MHFHFKPIILALILRKEKTMKITIGELIEKIDASEYALKTHPDTYCKDREDYIRIALAIETLAYHDKNLLNHDLAVDNAARSRVIQELLMEYLKGENNGR